MDELRPLADLLLEGSDIRIFQRLRRTSTFKSGLCGIPSLALPSTVNCNTHVVLSLAQPLLI
jgi:hypothetical protein